MEYRSPPVAAGLIFSLWVGALCLPLNGWAKEEAAAKPTPEQRADWDRRLEEAKTLQKEGATRKEQARQAFEDRKKECFKQFRVTDCQNKAKEQYVEVANEARRIENEGKARERQVKQEQLADKDARHLAEEPQRAADLQARSAAREAETDKYEEHREATLAKKEEKAQAGAQRHAAAEERQRAKQEKHDRQLAAKMEKARQREREEEH